MESPIFARGYLASSKGGELVKRLEATHVILKKMEQASDDTASVAGLDNVAAGLVAQGVLHSSESDVRLLACVGLVDVLRVYAPDAPFAPLQLLVSQLANLPYTHTLMR